MPRGVVCGITSFNAPLNFVAHKAGPALAVRQYRRAQGAAGDAVQRGAARARSCSTPGCRPAHVNLVQGPGSEVGRWLIENQQIRFYTFTGSTAVGKQLHRDVGLRPIALELGSIAATLVCEDGDLDRAAPRVANSAFRRAGQACTSTQRLFVHRSVLEPFIEKFVAATAKLKVGDPSDPETAIGPMISEAEAARAEQWVNDAVAHGARIVSGGQRRGALLSPTILVDARRDMKILCEEIFAPVVSIIPFDVLDDAIARNQLD